MTGAQLRAIREARGECQWEFALALGYRGNRNSLSVLVCQMETGVKNVPPWRAHLANELKEKAA